MEEGSAWRARGGQRVEGAWRMEMRGGHLIVTSNKKPAHGQATHLQLNSPEMRSLLTGKLLIYKV